MNKVNMTQKEVLNILKDASGKGNKVAKALLKLMDFNAKMELAIADIKESNDLMLSMLPKRKQQELERKGK